MGQFFSCVSAMAHPAVKIPLAYLFSKMIKCNVKGATYILYTIIFQWWFKNYSNLYIRFFYMWLLHYYSYDFITTGELISR